MRRVTFRMLTNRYLEKPEDRSETRLETLIIVTYSSEKFMELGEGNKVITLLTFDSPS